MIMERAFLRAKERFGEVNPQTVNKAMETFTKENFGGLVPDVTYTERDHGASFTARIVQIHEDGSFSPLTAFFSPGKDTIKFLKKK